MLTPEHSYPHCVAEWGVSGNGQVNRLENLNYRRGPQSLFACPLHPPHPYSAKQGKGIVQGSVYCSASLRAADDDHHECQALKTLFNIFEAPFKKKIEL